MSIQEVSCRGRGKTLFAQWVLFLVSALQVQTTAAQQGLEVHAEFSLLLQQFLPGTQQITILLQPRLGYADERQQAIGVELASCTASMRSVLICSPRGLGMRVGATTSHR